MRPGLSHQTDEQLAALGRGGSDDAFAEIVRRYEPALRAKCTRIAGRSLADDALAQTWLQAFAALRRPSSPPVLAPWLHRVAYNCAIDQLRSRRQQESLAPPRAPVSDSPEAELERKQNLRDLVRGLATLPENQRDALVLREFEGWSYAQIAEWVEAPPAGIHQLIFRARSTLRRGLCALAPWTPLRTLLQHASALAPSGGGGSLRLCLAVIGTALIGGGGVTSGGAGASAWSDDRPRSPATKVSTAAPGHYQRAASHSTSEAPDRSMIALRVPLRSRTGHSPRQLVWTGAGSAPEVPAELVSPETPVVPAPSPPSADFAPPEPGQDPTVVDATGATPAADTPDAEGSKTTASEPHAATQTPTETDATPEPADEEPTVAEPPPAADDHPGQGHGPPSWALAKGHGKHAAA